MSSTENWEFPVDFAEQANREAKLVPAQGDTPAYIEIAGIKVYVDLNVVFGALHVQVELGDVDDRLVRPDDVVPHRVEFGSALLANEDNGTL